MFDSTDSFVPEDYHEEISGCVRCFAKMLETRNTEGPPSTERIMPSKSSKETTTRRLAACCLLEKMFLTNIVILTGASAGPSPKRKLVPQAFVLERIWAIFQAIREESHAGNGKGTVNGSAGIQMAIATLGGLRLLVRVGSAGADDALDGGVENGQRCCKECGC
jgi:hypothetical protein